MKVAEVRTKIIEAINIEIFENKVNKFLYDLPEGDFIEIKFSTAKFSIGHTTYTALIIYK